MIKLKLIITPKWTGSIPIEVTTGYKIDAVIKRAGNPSITIPATIKKILINPKAANGLPTALVIDSAASWADLSAVTTQLITAETATIYIINAVVVADWTIAL